MSYQLFYADGSASMGVRVLLEEIGATYELITTTIDMNQARPAEQLALNPNGWIPVLLYGDQSMYECAAITILLCDRHPQAALAPAPDSPLRGLYLQTLVYFSSSVQTAFQLSYYPQRFADSAAHEVGAQKRANSRLYEVWQIVDQQIGDNDWLLGERFSAADIYLFMLVTWLKTERGHPGVEQFPNVNRIARAVAQRPAVKTVYRDWLAMQG